MAWVIANTGEAYEGDTHEFLGKTYSGKTRTTESRRLDWIEAPIPSQQKPARAKPAPRPKAPPKPKGATAWD